MQPAQKIGRKGIFVAFVLAVAALAARAPFLMHGETMLHSDEGIVGLMAEDIAESRRFPIYFYGQRYMGALEAYVIAPFVNSIQSPVIWLRLGPAIIFSLLVAVQFLMLNRWFGFWRALIGASTLIVAAPAFLHWSIAARGGYVEIFLWGTLLWWTYYDCFVMCDKPSRAAKWGLGFLLGSGMWINPMILAFAAPIAAHRIASHGLPVVREHPVTKRWLATLDSLFPTLPLGAFCVGITLMLIVNLTFTVYVRASGVRYCILLGLVPPVLGLSVVGIVAVALLLWFVRTFQPLGALRHLLATSAPFVAGMLIGYAPNAVYVLGHVLQGLPLDDSLPMAIRPLWTIGETLGYVSVGIPILFGADAGSFLKLVLVGRDYRLFQLSPELDSAMSIVNYLSLICLGILVLLVIFEQRKSLARLLRFQPACIGPEGFLLLAGGAFVALYLISACAFDFTSIRYLVPLWIVVPGLVAAALRSPRMIRLSQLATLLLICGWGMGQACFYSQLGSPHPLNRLATELVRRDVKFALAEPYDAHLVSYLTRQRVQLGEFMPFWNRLDHFRTRLSPGQPVAYLVHVTDHDWTTAWQWPGPAPAETRRRLWPRLRAYCQEHPEELLSQETLVDGFEIWTTSSLVPEDTEPAPS